MVTNSEVSFMLFLQVVVISEVSFMVFLQVVTVFLYFFSFLWKPQNLKKKIAMEYKTHKKNLCIRNDKYNDYSR